MFWNNLYPTWKKKNPVFLPVKTLPVNLSLFKDLNPCRHAPLLVTDYEKWHLKTIGVVGFIHAC